MVCWQKSAFGGTNEPILWLRHLRIGDCTPSAISGAQLSLQPSYFGNVPARIRYLADVQIETGSRQQRCQRKKLEAGSDRLRLAIDAGLTLNHLPAAFCPREEFLRFGQAHGLP